MKVHLTVLQKGLFVVAITLCFEFGIIAKLYDELTKSHTEISRAYESKTILDELNRLNSFTSQGMIDVLIYSRTKDRQHRAKFHKDLTLLEQSINTLGKLCKSDRRRAERFPPIKAGFQKVVDLYKTVDETLEEGRRADSILFEIYDWRKSLNSLVIETTEHVNKLSDEEQNIANRIDLKKSEENIKNILEFGLLANIVIAVGAAYLFNAGIARRVGVLTDNAYRLAADKPLLAQIKGTDEIARLDAVFHGMAESLSIAMKKQRAIIDNAKDLICSIDKTGTFTALNPAVEEVLGYTTDELEGTSCYDLLADGSTNLFDDPQSEIWDNPLELQFLRRDGQISEIVLKATWSSDEQMYVCVMHDITRRKEVERLKQQVVEMVSHDLRSPLSSLLAYLTAIPMGVYGEVTDKLMTATRRSERSVKRLMSLINDLLDMEKLEAGKLDLDQDICNLSVILTNSVDALEGLAPGRIKIESDENIEVFADSERITQVLINLLGNALKFSPNESTVTISSQILENEVKIRVVDKGRGIPEAVQQRIFERFQQVSTQDGRRGSGSGLGLAICKSIVELHGGAIGVTSTEGQGSTFWFTINLAHDSGDLARAHE